MKPNRGAQLTLAGLVLAILALRHDFWWWDNDYLVFGFLPIDLFWQALISLAAAAVWFYATWTVWPEDLEGDMRPAPAANQNDDEAAP